MKTVEVRFEPDGISIEVERGTLLSGAILMAGIFVQFPCGGAGKCGKCAVEIHPKPPEPNPVDRLHLTADDLARGVRLACRTRVGRDMTVVLSPRMRETGGKILTNAFVNPDPAAGTDTTGNKYGFAFDLGTTTVAGSLIDLSTGRVLSSAGRLNPQAVHGADVISRITFARDTEGGRETLTREIRDTVNDIIAETTEHAGIDPLTIHEAVFAGNTTMSTLFAGLDPSGLAEIPFRPGREPEPSYATDEFGIGINPGGRLRILPNIAGFVGSDTVAVMLAGGFADPGPARLAVDVGTNGEIALRRADGVLMVCSTAAGPALEGAALSSGMRAADGAIQHVAITADCVACDVIGNIAPIGICGSGIIDAVAALLDGGIVDSSGRLRGRDELSGRVPAALLDRIADTDDGRAFLLVRAGENGTRRDIAVTQRDIRQVQLAKGAIAAGIELLLREADVSPDDLAEIQLAGAFGNYIRVRGALRIGFLPPVPEERVRFVENAVLDGAKLALRSPAIWADADRIRREAKHLELAALPDFTDTFTEHMLFP